MRNLRGFSLQPALLAFLLIAGCASPKKPSHSQPNSLPAAHAHALLFDLLGDEKDVSKLLIIKRERPELGALIKQISRVSGAAYKRLEAFGKADPSLNLKDLGLPSGEIETREAIAKTKSKALLTEKGKEFELQLLLSQSEALAYGAHLARIIAPRETNLARAKFFQDVSNELTDLQHRVFEMLLSHYSI